MLPISYENQCRACHRLDYDPQSPDRNVPHGLQPARVLESLRTTYLAEYLAGNPKLLERQTPVVTKPGRVQVPEAETVRRAIDAKVLKAARILFGSKKCGECHPFTNADGTAIPSALPDLDSLKSVQVPATEIPSIWFQHARFDHSPHQALSCRECHAGAYSTSTVASDVLLPGIATCLNCHSPRADVAKARQGGAGYACTECHRYHNGDIPLEGRGALARDARAEMDIQDFLEGK
jgi:hypothetical protein